MRRGMTEAEAGAIGGRGHRYRTGGPGLGASVQTRREAAMRWAMREATQAELGAEYGVHRSTVRRWCRELEEWWHDGPA
jgi:helix-turn-helix protein